MSTDRQLLQPNVDCRVDVNDGLKPMKMTDVQKLAMLREKARTESGNFTCLDFFKALLFIGIVCTFAFVFYRIAVLQQEVDTLSSRYNVIQAQLIRPACNCSRQTSPSRYDKYRVFGRHRRSANGETQQESEDRAAVAAQNEIDTQIPTYTNSFSAHLLPTDGDTTLYQGQLFEWTDNKTQSFLQPSGFELINNHYLYVPVGGYYFVYSQITFNDSLTRTIGHQLLRWGRCGGGRSTILMGTSLTQQHRPPTDLSDAMRDSSYLGGVFYLSAGDYLAVRPDLDGTTKADFARLDSNTFFGAFLVSKDSKARSVKENCSL